MQVQWLFLDATGVFELGVASNVPRDIHGFSDPLTALRHARGTIACRIVDGNPQSFLDASEVLFQFAEHCAAEAARQTNFENRRLSALYFSTIETSRQLRLGTVTNQDLRAALYVTDDSTAGQSDDPSVQQALSVLKALVNGNGAIDTALTAATRSSDAQVDVLTRLLTQASSK